MRKREEANILLSGWDEGGGGEEQGAGGWRDREQGRGA